MVSLAANGTALTLNASGNFGNAVNIGGGVDATIAAGAGQTTALTGGLTLGTGATPVDTLHLGSAGNTGTLGLSGTGGTVVPGLTVSVDAGTFQPLDAAAAALTAGTGSTLNVGAAGTVNLNGIGTTTANLTGNGTITNNGAAAATLVADAGNFAGSIQNGTSVTALDKVGAGTLALTGTSTFSGPTTINGGTLDVGGSIANSAVTISSGGTLAGTGTVGGPVTAMNGSIVAPGSSAGATSTGTLTVAGNVNLAAGSALDVRLGSNGQGTQLAATGTATLSGGTVNVQPVATLTPNLPYAILTAAGGVSGTFGSLNGLTPSAFLTPKLSFDPTSVFVTMAFNGTSFASVAQTPNQASVAAAVQTLGFGNPVAAAILSTSAPQARQAFDLLSGEIHPSVSSVLIDESHEVRDAVTDRVRQLMSNTTDPRLATLAPTGPVVSSNQGTSGEKRPVYYKAKPIPAVGPESLVYATWAHGFGSWGRIDGRDGLGKIDHSSGGFISGVDATFNGTWRVGLAGGYSRTSFNVDDRASSGGSDNYHVAVYGGGQVGAWGLRTGVAYTWHDIDTSRGIVFPGFAGSAQAGYSAHTTQVFGEIGYSIAAGPVALEPFAGLAYVHFDSNPFTEWGGPAALAGGKESRDVTYTTLGLHAASNFLMSDSTVLVARGTVGWRSAFGDVTPITGFAFASGSAPFAVTGVPIARDSAVVEAGLDWKVRRDMTLSVTYTGALADKAQSHAVQSGFVVKF